jgi:2-polyprenyl-3-methyl-5-hydroxy-6-metoxy-1,4-benzoquinol methylase/ribosomal protein S27E
MKEQEIRDRNKLNEYLRLVEQDVRTIFADQSLFVQVNCPACSGADHVSQFDKNGFIYVQCSSCGTLFVNPRPSVTALERFYTEAKSSIFWVEEFFKPMAEARREKIFKPRAEYIRDRIPGVKKAVIGDVGAGFGLFLEELKKLLPEARTVAIEPSPQMVEICKGKGLEVVPTIFERISGYEGTFDLLTAFELMEHLYDPGELIRQAVKLLKPGGHLFFTTLNGEGFDIQVLWERSKSIMPPHHLNFFNSHSITKLLKENRLEVVEVSTPGKLDWDIVEKMYREEKVDPGRLWKTFSKRASEKSKNELQLLLERSGMSSHMRVIARKGER